MLRRALLIVAVPVAVCVVVLAFVFGGAITGAITGDCRLSSVDETEFVAGNRAILDELPVYPGSTRRATRSHGWIADDQCFYGENSGPIERYQTSDSFTLPSDGRVIVSVPWKVPDRSGNWVRARAPSVLLYYARQLKRRGWRRMGRSWTASEMQYRKGKALLVVSAQLNEGDPYKREPYYTLDVVHDLE